VVKIFDELGLTSSEAIILFLKQVELHLGLLFNIRLPGYNTHTMHVIREASNDNDLQIFDNADEFFKDLEI